MTTTNFPKTAMEFESRFATEEACRAYLMQIRWPEGWRCAHCGHSKGWATGRALWHCAQCGYQSSVTAGTLFHGTNKPLRLWFKAMYLITAAKNGLSAKTLERELGISYPTAWTWLHKLRQVMASGDSAPLAGVVEVDETMWGNDESRSPGRHKGDKTIIVIAVEDQGHTMGRARMSTIEDFSAESLHPAIERDVARGATVHTDGWRGYMGLDSKGYHHVVDVLDGATGQAEREDRADGMFPHVHMLATLLKRWILGTHQGAVQEKHIQAYLDEFVFRFNRRSSHRRTLLFERLADRAVSRKPKPYWRIIGREAPDKPLHLAAA